jgi:hypothetical protein
MSGWVTALALMIDLAAIIASGLAAWLWYIASKNQVHRVSKHETFDYHDLNRVIVVINRNSIRNRRAALASAAAAALIGIDLALVLIIGGS